MEVFTALTKGGKNWTPRFIESIKQEECIGCGRCFKACGRDVLFMIGMDEDGEIVDAFDDEAERKIMSIKDAENCIGCEACLRACGKNCFSHSPLAVSAA